MKLWRVTHGGWSNGDSGHGKTFVRWFSSKALAAAWVTDRARRGWVEGEAYYQHLDVPTTRDALAKFLTERSA